MARKKTYRRYSDDERAAALAALASNAGNLTRTARELGIPKATLESWARGAAHPEASKNSEAKKGPLADAIEAVARAIADSLPGKVPDADLKDAAVALGVLVDKMQLLRGRPTGISRHDLSEIPDDELDRRIEAAERELAALEAGEAQAGAAAAG